MFNILLDYRLIRPVVRSRAHRRPCDASMPLVAKQCSYLARASTSRLGDGGADAGRGSAHPGARLSRESGRCGCLCASSPGSLSADRPASPEPGPAVNERTNTPLGPPPSRSAAPPPNPPSPLCRPSTGVLRLIRFGPWRSRGSPDTLGWDEGRVAHRGFLNFPAAREQQRPDVRAPGSGSVDDNDLSPCCSRA